MLLVLTKHNQLNMRMSLINIIFFLNPSNLLRIEYPCLISKYTKNDAERFKRISSNVYNVVSLRRKIYFINILRERCVLACKYIYLF